MAARYEAATAAADMIIDQLGLDRVDDAYRSAHDDLRTLEDAQGSGDPVDRASYIDVHAAQGLVGSYAIPDHAYVDEDGDVTAAYPDPGERVEMTAYFAANMASNMAPAFEMDDVTPDDVYRRIMAFAHMIDPDALDADLQDDDRTRDVYAATVPERVGALATGRSRVDTIVHNVKKARRHKFGPHLPIVEGWQQIRTFLS